MLNQLRPALSRVTSPVGHALARTGVTPNTVTIIGTLGCVVGALAFYPFGEFFWGTIVITVFVFFDLFDGAVARVTGKVSRFGAFLDSNMDRVSDAAIFTGLILRFSSRDHNDMLLVCLALFCLISGALVSYARARAEGMGINATIGIAERGERLIVSLVAIGLAGLGVPYVLAAGLWLLSIASAITVVQRYVVVRRHVEAGDLS
ncbi:CDP-alcohol phosphatidyltransferase family protein [Actinoallomurus bryophytorum]|jgi:CDP-diacylglycerol--glycerol-3-phosphate 3-phosphatidyltransferase|uniref:Phosphatidylinositol phosphate synthase n=1 Tax=Actinoallomurus bryophytorum TaxID=1490222 RepID=A0A543CWD1_9ACTN|nr:CDP-alcohol phosphatidyltransferase family protein [Actinoallomurus bryophytorum]TQM01168.1 CDP-diacylglycerol inositol 3-phosphatidyltransferase [Actinoallomurus bryophytorum]